MQPDSGDRVIEQTVARLWLGNDGVARLAVREGALITLDHAHALLEALRELSGDRPTPVIVDLPRYANGDAEGRRFFGGPEVTRAVTAVALIVRSPVMRVVASFIVRVSGAPFPARSFHDEEEAITWARGHVRR